MTEIVLGLTVLILSGLLAWKDYLGKQERKSLTNALVAKNNQELVNLELADKTRIQTAKEEEQPPDYVEPNALSDEEYEKIITQNVPSGV